jgi:hypothetical protein
MTRDSAEMRFLGKKDRIEQNKITKLTSGGVLSNASGRLKL